MSKLFISLATPFSLDKCFFCLLAFLLFCILTAAPQANAYSILTAAPLDSTMIDFQNYTPGDYVTTIGIVTFSSVDGSGDPRIDSNEAPYYGHGVNGGNIALGAYSLNSADAALSIVFSGGVDAAGMTYIDGSPAVGRSFFFDIDNTLIGTFVANGDHSFWGMMTEGDDARIGSVLIDNRGGYDGLPLGGYLTNYINETDFGASYTIDDLFYSPIEPSGAEPSPVPEPSTILLLGSGLLGLGWYGRRRTKA